MRICGPGEKICRQDLDEKRGGRVINMEDIVTRQEKRHKRKNKKSIPKHGRGFGEVYKNVTLKRASKKKKRVKK